MDDTALRTLADRLQYLRNLAQRREEIRRGIGEKLTDELDAAITAAKTLSELEDLYRPYNPQGAARADAATGRFARAGGQGQGGGDLALSDLL